MPLMIVGEEAPMPPPMPLTPLMVSKGLLVLSSQMILPSEIEYARRMPSRDPVKTAPGMTVAADQLPELQVSREFGSAQLVGLSTLVYHTRLPPAFGSIAASAPV